MMNLEANVSQYKVIKAKKTDKKDIMRFYKSQRYTASYIGHDQCYIVRHDNFIIASAIVSSGKAVGDIWLLHGLVINETLRGNNIASLILQKIVSRKNEQAHVMYEEIICFADISLQFFYQKNNFISFDTNNDLAKLPFELQQRFMSYRAKNKKLCCFIYHERN